MIVHPLEVLTKHLHDERLSCPRRTHHQDVLTEGIIFFWKNIKREMTSVEVVKQKPNDGTVMIVNNKPLSLIPQQFVADCFDGIGVIHIHVVVGEIVRLRTGLSSLDARSPPVF